MINTTTFKNAYFSDPYMVHCFGVDWDSDLPTLDLDEMNLVDQGRYGLMPLWDEMSRAQRISYVSLFALDCVTWIFRRAFHEVKSSLEKRERRNWVRLDTEWPQTQLHSSNELITQANLLIQSSEKSMKESRQLIKESRLEVEQSRQTIHRSEALITNSNAEVLLLEDSLVNSEKLYLNSLINFSKQRINLVNQSINEKERTITRCKEKIRLSEEWIQSCRHLILIGNEGIGLISKSIDARRKLISHHEEKIMQLEKSIESCRESIIRAQKKIDETERLKFDLTLPEANKKWEEAATKELDQIQREYDAKRMEKLNLRAQDYKLKD